MGANQSCFPLIGCFSSENFIQRILTTQTTVGLLSSALSLKQLLSISPLSPDSMNVTFYMFTNQSNTIQALRYNSTNDAIKASNFSSNRTTVFIAHGYKGGFMRSIWMENTKNYFLDFDYNVVIVDWSKAANSLEYFNAAFNTQIVGSIVAFYIRRLMHVFAIRPENVHLVGHSLGAHVMGFAGKNFTSNEKMGYISGLDPAALGFLMNDTNTRLAKTDARLVVITHTGAGVLKFDNQAPLEFIQLFGLISLADPLGHYDFRPNGGTGQPGCEQISNKTLAKLQKSITGPNINSQVLQIGCSHLRVLDYVIADRNLRSENSCQLIAYECDSYDQFIDGNCADCGTNGEKCKPLEFNPKFWFNASNRGNGFNTSPNNLYLRTSGSQPYCLFHYQIVVNITKSEGVGQLKITLYADKTVEIILTNGLTGFQSGNNYTALHTDTNNLGQISGANVAFDTNLVDGLIGIVFVKPSALIQSIQINFMSHWNGSVRKRNSVVLVPQNGSTNKFVRQQ